MGTVTSPPRDVRTIVAKVCIWIYVLVFGAVMLVRTSFVLATAIGFLTVEPLKQYPSPDGKWILATYYIHQSMPPETDFWVNLRPAGTPLRHWGGHLIPVTEYADEVYVDWQSNRSLIITFAKFYGRSEDELLRHATHVADIDITVNLLKKPQQIEVKKVLSSDIEKQMKIGVQILQRESGTSTNWVTEVNVCEISEYYGMAPLNWARVLALDGKYTISVKKLTREKIVLLIEAPRINSPLEQINSFQRIPIRFVYSDDLP